MNDITILFINNNVHDLTMWDKYVEIIRLNFNDIQIIRYNSGLFISNEENKANFIVNEINNLFLEKKSNNIIIISHSFGSLCAKLYAEKYPNKIKGIISLDASNYCDRTKLFVKNQIKFLYRPDKPIIYPNMTEKESINRTNKELYSYKCWHDLEQFIINSGKLENIDIHHFYTINKDSIKRYVKTNLNINKKTTNDLIIMKNKNIFDYSNIFNENISDKSNNFDKELKKFLSNMEEYIKYIVCQIEFYESWSSNVYLHQIIGYGDHFDIYNELTLKNVIECIKTIINKI